MAFFQSDFSLLPPHPRRATVRGLRATVAALAIVGSAGCSASSAGQDVMDAPAVVDGPTQCRWRADPPTTIPTTMGSTARLLALQSVPDATWVVYAETAGMRDTIQLRRLSARAQLIDPASRSVGSLMTMGPLRASIATGQNGQRRLFVEQHDSYGPCQIATVDASGTPTSPLQSARLQPPMQFPVAGCRDATAIQGRDGYRYIAEQVRAALGMTLVEMNAAGEQIGGVDLQWYYDPGSNSHRRFVVGVDRSLLVWPLREPSGERALRVRVLNDLDPMEAHPTRVVRQTRFPIHDYRLVATPGGSMLAFEEDVDSLPVLGGVSLQALDREGAPSQPLRPFASRGFYRGGLALAAVRNELLMTAAFGGGGEDGLTLFVLDTNGNDRSDPVVISRDEPQTSELVATNEGALLVYQTGDSARALVAVALRCE